MSMASYYKKIEAHAPHGQEGHINVFVLDEESPCTGFGKHNRVVAFLPDVEGLYVRVDLQGRRMPTDSEILRVAKLHQGVGGRWKRCREEWHTHKRSLDVYFSRIR